MASKDVEEMDYDQPLRPRMSLFEEYGPDVTGRMGRKNRLYSTQLEALDHITEWFSNDMKKNKTAVVQMPTGSGKTGIIACLPYSLGNAVREKKVDLDLTKPILIIAPGKVILDQLEKSLNPSAENFLMKRGLINQEEAKYALYSVRSVQSCREVSDLLSFQSNIIIANAQKFKTNPRKPDEATWKSLPNNMFSMVIVDEAHHLPSKLWELVIKKFRQPSTKVIFFTATPLRADGKEITTDRALKDIGYAYTLSREEAIRQRYIRDVEFYAIPFASSEISRHYVHTDVVKRLECAKLVLRLTVSLLDKKDEICPLPSGKRHAALIITRDMSEASSVMLNAQREHPGLSIAQVHGNVPEGDRKAAISYLKEGKIRIIVMVGMLLEGFDHPPLSVAAIATRIHSCVKFAQFIGRAQRIIRVEQEVEKNVKAHIITHEYFQQQKQYDEYITPSIPEEENDEHFTTIDSDND